MPASSYRFHPAAEVELREAADWYEDHREGLGLELLAAVRRKVIQVLETPSAVLGRRYPRNSAARQSQTR